jgi:hypothetical protein
MATRFVAEGYSERSSVTGAYVSLKYNQFAAEFYEEKIPGVLWVPANKHGKGRKSGLLAPEKLPEEEVRLVEMDSGKRESISMALSMKTVPLSGGGYSDDNELIVSKARNPLLPVVDPQEQKVKLLPEEVDRWNLDEKLQHLFSMKAEPAQLIIGSKKKR